MTTTALTVLDHAWALLGAGAWSAAGVTAARGRARPALVLLAVAMVFTVGKAATVTALAGRGWWFVQEKVLLGMPLLAVASVTALVTAGPVLLAQHRGSPGRAVGAAGVVALLSAGYAGLAGFAVTYLVGYPLTLPVALITVGMVAVGVLVTARTLGTPDAGVAAQAAPDPRPEVSRRRLLGVAGGVAAVGVTGTGVGLAVLPAATDITDGGGPGPARGSTLSVADLRGPDAPAPGGARRTHVLTARKAAVRLPSGADVHAWTFDGVAPGPQITATEGDLIEVRLVNHDIDGGVTLHWHGYDVPCGEDGVPDLTQDGVKPGASFVYRFRADQVGTYWYHTHHASHIGVLRGLYGVLVVKPRVEPDIVALDLVVPVHTFNGDAAVAGVEHVTAAGAMVRLRLVNTDSDPRRFALAGTPFRVVAVDGRDLSGPDETSRTAVRLPAGGRHDLVFAMPETSVALHVDGVAAVWLRPGPGAPDGETAVQETSGWPELDLLSYGTPVPVPLRDEVANRNFTLVLDRGLAMVDGFPAFAQTVNGRGHPSIPDELVAEGDVVRFTVVNRSLETHPWHLHGHPVLILSRNGRPPSGSPLWMDTFDVRPGEVWEVAFRATNPGIWMNHCHNLPHAHQGMMLHVRYDGFMTPFGDGHPSGHGHSSQ
ncbi:multicopper oxidase family protein [Micromonospora endolithica]|uniref:Multicopper oxidase family protein n=1 Tax=Micromonospora endolithica TaxID=230091 RepID=A0A3A9ZJF0_9ACTN|nr:multicopper oxidase family protein [Micromonospora endolithica]RKN48448.1 multicopper oxidase family protein [Micromonospora endolithica]TWJ24472.1 FtsP/CotA-like multicopper oxidase with cupredoxin domain [Micromonospora endolithica]